MVLPIEPIRAANPNLTRDKLDTILRVELGFLNAELEALNKYRNYYEGDQKLVFGTDAFKEKFGPTFENFRDNWSAPIVDATADKLVIEGILLGSDKEEQDANKDLAREIWNIFRENDIDEQQTELHEASLVEGRAYAIAWPDAELGVRIDWNPPQLVRVRYADDDPRKIIWAVKRWVSPSGEIYVTEYTPNFIYKFKEPPKELRTETRVGIDAQKPTQTTGFTFDERRVPDEQWPLPNPFGVVPVIEFLNKGGSELHDVIPLQDAINYLMLQAFTAAGFQGWRQRGMMTGVSEPVGGWSNEPGKVWQLPPDLDAEGSLHYGSMFEFQEADLSGLRSLIEMVLQHLALQKKTPVRMFFESDRGGRGDSPSGESLLIEDQPLLDKVENRQRRLGNSWFRLARMVAHMDKKIKDELPLGEMNWHDPRSKYRSALIEEGAKMVDKMGLPLKFVIRQLGLSQDEIEFLEAEIERDHEEKMAQKKEELEIEADAMPDPVVPPTQPAPRPASRPPAN